MGADLYLEPDFTKNQEKTQPHFERAVEARDKIEKAFGRDSDAYSAAQDKVWDAFGKTRPDDCYFRDNYNGYGLFVQMGISWWRDVIPLYAKKTGDLSPRGAKKLLKMIEAKADFHKTLKANIIEDYKKDGMDAADYYRKRYEHLHAFLTKAITEKKKIHCSL